jgi:hypothetical protein
MKSVKQDEPKHVRQDKPLPLKQDDSPRVKQKKSPHVQQDDPPRVDSDRVSGGGGSPVVHLQTKQPDRSGTRSGTNQNNTTANG